MPDYGHDLMFGAFLNPAAGRPQNTVALAQLCEAVGLDLISYQDHPYQASFYDTWTLLSYLAAATSTIRIAPNVLNLPLRPPAVVARSAASLDQLSGGRVELGLGSGAFWDAIEAMGGQRLRPAEAVQALKEAVAVIRGIWDTTARGPLRVDGRFHHVHGAKRGPEPAHDIGIWLGAYKPRMLALTGQIADGWLPSMGYLEPEQLAAGNAAIDEAAIAAGRAPADIRRMLNISGSFTDHGAGLLQGPSTLWVEQLAELALRDGISAFILGGDDPAALERFAGEVAPAVRELVDAERHVPEQPRERSHEETIPPHADLGVPPTLDTGERLSPTRLWDEDSRPSRPDSPADTEYSERGRAIGQHLVDVHDQLRTELTRIRDLITQVRSGAIDAAAARSAINEMTMRQNNWTLGAYCASYCRILTEHHGLEDDAIFPHLRASEPGLRPVIDRLVDEHKIIHGVLDDVDRALVDTVEQPDGLAELQSTMDVLTDALLSHLSYEERELVEPLARLGFYAGQI
ncbi:MAG TPA: LLM class flavin-dependent oxidoreductase [Mycobacteriales bacterium]|jgi:alkanesulfonate monooxygenase SsuD/methylene tetrahydromethanopterin reductase-like flavin-dependent oxidoreductase (luciferase family)|nr:LLM class flavin-dependent oxidoreductase [Mycobacteriales bacterium]